jgi:hypothetical protein
MSAVSKYDESLIRHLQCLSEVLGEFVIKPLNIPTDFRKASLV